MCTITLNSQPRSLLEMWVVPCLSAQVGQRWRRIGFPTRVSLQEEKKKMRGRRKAIQLLFSVCCSHHGQHFLSCTCYYVEIWLFSDLAISVALLWIIRSGKRLKRESQLIREELKCFIALLKMLVESGTTFNQTNTQNAYVRPPIFGIFHFFSNWCHTAQEMLVIKAFY